MDSQRTANAALLVWGKTDRSEAPGQLAWNPLLAHMIDVAACAGELWDVYLAEPVRSRLISAFGGEPTKARQVAQLLAGLHDLGKAAPCFLGTFAKGRRHLREAAVQWERAARAAGLPLPPDLAAPRQIPHQHITAAHLPRLLGCMCDECKGDGPRDAGLHAVAALLSGHHGHLAGNWAIEQARGGAYPEWDPIHNALIDVLAAAVGIERSYLAGRLDLTRPSVLPMFTGLVSLADWVASDTDHFPFCSPDQVPDQRWTLAQDRAKQALRSHHLKAWQPAERSWRQLFPRTNPRPVQEATIRALQEVEGPVLALIESQTASGKTWLGLWCAYYLARTRGYHGFYLAVPTRAAADEHTEHAEGLITRSKSDTAAANLVVAHSTSQASPTAIRLTDAFNTSDGFGPGSALAPAAADIAAHTGCEAESPTVVLDPWYFQHQLALISPFGVGTIDQVVLASQRSRYWFLRLFGLANKTVIIDEAHAYDLYQRRVLEATIAWLADAGASIVILSATLPGPIRDSLIRAWCSGHRATAPVGHNQAGPVTVIDQNGVTKHISLAATGTAAKMVDLLDNPGTKDVATRLLEENASGGIAMVIRNRVDSASELHTELLSQASEHGWRPEQIILVHGRQLPRSLIPTMTRLIKTLGPGKDATVRNPARPERLILVGTQLLEQSLDIDADRLYTDLAPIDLLLQRLGRLWRHAVNDGHRHAHHSPHATILWSSDPTKIPFVEPVDNAGRPTDANVYARYLLAASWYAITTYHGADPTPTIPITIPADCPILIDRVYRRPPELQGPIGTLLVETWADYCATQPDKRLEADKRTLLPYIEGAAPSGTDDLATGEAHGSGGTRRNRNMPGYEAKSRLVDDSIPVVVLFEQPKGIGHSYDQPGKLLIDLIGRRSPRTDEERHAHQAEIRNLLLNTVNVPRRWLPSSAETPATALERAISRWHPVNGVATLILNPDGTSTRAETAPISYAPHQGLTYSTSH